MARLALTTPYGTSPDDVQATNVFMTKAQLDASVTPELAATAISVPNTVVNGWVRKNDAWQAPPPPPVPADPTPMTPASYYLTKVVFERRLSNEAFAALDGLRVTIAGRPGDWATTQAEPWVSLRPFVRPVSDYGQAERVNVVDPAFNAILQTLQAQQQVFGADPVAAQTEIARILTPGPLAGEPTD